MLVGITSNVNGEVLGANPSRIARQNVWHNATFLMTWVKVGFRRGRKPHLNYLPSPPRGGHGKKPPSYKPQGSLAENGVVEEAELIQFCPPNTGVMTFGG